MVCKRCNVEINENFLYGKGIFCSKRCQLRYSFELRQEEIIKKTSKTLTLERRIIFKECEKCKTEFKITRNVSKDNKEIIRKKEKRFCSRICANSIGGSKNSEKLIRYNLTCEKCNKKFKTVKKEKRFCESHNYYEILCKEKRKCVKCDKLIKKINKTGFCQKCLYYTKEGRAIRSDLAKKVMTKTISEGKHKGWQSRNIRSYLEKFFERVLIFNKLFDECKVEYKINKSDLGINSKYCYFLDFYFPEKKINLEIDGRQHNFLDRKESDKIRDEHLIKNGINVYRIKWKNINNKEGKIYIKNEIEKFLNYYSDVV